MKRVLIVSMLIVCPASMDEAIASCGSATCPLETHSYLREGWLQMGFIYEYVHQDRIYLRSSPSFVGAVPQVHNEVQTVNQREILQLQYGMLDILTLAVDLPLIHREHSHIIRDAGGDALESWNFSGLGDVVVTGQLALLLPRSTYAPFLSFVVGAKLPSGMTNAKNAEGEEAEVSIQPGSGSLDGILGINYRQVLASVPMISGEYTELALTASLTHQMNGKGKKNWRFGNTTIASIGSSYQVNSYASLLFQVNGKFQGFADVGSTGDPGENTGGTWIYASPGFGLRLTETFAATAFVQIPLYQNVHGLQQTSNLNMQIGLSATVDLLGQ